MNADATKVYVIIGANLKRFRKEKKMSQQDLANKCEKVDRAKISDIENAKEDFMFSTILDICNALDKSLEEMIIKYEAEAYQGLTAEK